MHIYIYLKHFRPSGPPIKLGTGKAVHGLATGFVRAGEQVTVLCEGPEDSVTDMPSGYRLRCFQNRRSKVPFVVSKGLLRFLDGANGIVVLNGMFHPSVFRLAMHLAYRGIPYIIAPHGAYHPDTFSKNLHLKWPYWFLCEKRILKRAAAIQILDSRHAQYLDGLGIETPTLPAPNGFLDEDVANIADLKWEGRSNLLFLGRIDKHCKGLDLLIDSVANLKGRVGG